MTPKHWQSTRHTFVWVDASDWAQLCARYPGRYPADWAAAARPLIVRRPGPGDAACEVPLGLALPEGKRRVALTLPEQAVIKMQSPPLLSRARHAAPAAWQPGIEALITLNPQIRVFGSLAWSAFTGLAYLTPASDLDLLFDISDDPGETLYRVSRLVELERSMPMRLDGECVRADGCAVNWRELAGSAPQVLVKGFGPPRMMSPEAFLTDHGAPVVSYQEAQV